MRTAAAADNLGTFHTKAVVCFFYYIFFIKRGIKTGPSGTAFKLCGAAEQRLAAANTIVGAFVVVVPIFARKGSFGACLAGNLKLHGSQYFFPLVIGFGNGKFLCKACSGAQNNS